MEEKKKTKKKIEKKKTISSRKSSEKKSVKQPVKQPYKLAQTFGRPTKYDPKFNQEMIDFFDIEPFREEFEITTGNGWEKETKKLVPNKLPFISAFARKINVATETLYDWAREIPDFSVTLKKAQELQKEFLIQNAVNGLYNATSFIFTAKNITDMHDQKQIELSGDKDKPVKVEISKLFPIEILE